MSEERQPLNVSMAPVRSANIRGLMPRMPEKGHIKIGGLGQERPSQRGGTYQLPVKFDHFVVTTLERGKDGNFLVDTELHEKLKLGDKPTAIPIRFLFDDIDLVMQTRYACYAGKTLWCSGDGETASRISKVHNDGEPFKDGPRMVACPCHGRTPPMRVRISARSTAAFRP